MSPAKPRLAFNASVLGTLFFLISSASVQAALKYYYDPATGNVSFDTTETRNGQLHTYALSISSTAPFVFRHENQIRLSNSTLFTRTPYVLGDSTQDEQWRGLYTLGNILPEGLTEETWTTFFTTFFDDPPIGRGSHAHVDIVGGGVPERAAFIYGAPSGEFNNRLDLVDPALLRWADRATLTYVARSGDVIVRTSGKDGGYITGISLKSSGDFLPEAFAPTIDPGVFASATPDSIFMMVNLIEPGQIRLGQILPAGLTADEFESLFTSAKFLGRAGFKAQSFDFDTQGRDFQLAFAVPEPSTTLLIVVASLAMLRRRS
jgi:hypothetical protein